MKTKTAIQTLTTALDMFEAMVITLHQNALPLASARAMYDAARVKLPAEYNVSMSADNLSFDSIVESGLWVVNHLEGELCLDHFRTRKGYVKYKSTMLHIAFANIPHLGEVVATVSVAGVGAKTVRGKKVNTGIAFDEIRDPFYLNGHDILSIDYSEQEVKKTDSVIENFFNSLMGIFK